MKHIAILGSTGSIGQNTLEVIRHFPDAFRISALSTNSNIAVLYGQIKEFRPQFVAVRDINASQQLSSRLDAGTKLFVGDDGLRAMLKEQNFELIVLAISGSGALLPLLQAIETKSTIALANKEALVMAGPLVMHKLANKKAKIIPVDSEQSAIWQCLRGQDHLKLKNIYLTASGGPLLKMRPEDLKNISLKKVLRHPRWKMGKKITVDSATLMNKGLEVLETMFLFNLTVDKIRILIHPEAIIHSMVEFIDGIILAQLSATDMRIPIQYALLYPERTANSLPNIDFYKLKGLHFEKPDFKKFPCLRLAYQAARELGTMPCVLNAANEVGVDEFLRQRLPFLSIAKVIERVMDRHQNKIKPDLVDIQEADAWARREAYRVMERLN